ncbi:MAG: BlaI/MecI/CopY family transcriptional regulator [Fidelibacterota bacterium]|nr:MAG: BlaI/MecI/CopY family transcriptional regulator [Candidatus Neomarinimicrobiota bacterium]
MKQTPLPDSELAIMDLLWGNEWLTARQIREQLYSHSSKAQHGTVQRLLQRLEEKGYIERDCSQFVHQFRAKVSRQNYTGNQLEMLASKLTAGSFAPLITHLVEKSKISSDDIEQIKAILDEYRVAGGKND